MHACRIQHFSDVETLSFTKITSESKRSRVSGMGIEFLLSSLIMMSRYACITCCHLIFIGSAYTPFLRQTCVALTSPESYRKEVEPWSFLLYFSLLMSTFVCGTPAPGCGARGNCHASVLRGGNHGLLRGRRVLRR